MNEWNEPVEGEETASQERRLAAQKVAEENKHWTLIEKAVMANSRELRASRRWGILFKSLTFIYLFVLLFMVWEGVRDSGEFSTGGHTAIVQVRGVIADGEEASADNVVSGLRSAFKHKDTRGIVIRINSPGGSPVQSGYIYDEIDRLQQMYPDIPVNAVIVDSGASGAYYLAAAADNIYADKASIVGSIGVTAASFGFSEVIDRIGIERRQFTAGEHKAFLDPFSPVRPDEKELFETLLNNVHEQFVSAVRVGRGDRLKEDSKTFSGLFWTGEQALKMGLIDDLKSTSQVAREYGYPEIVDFTPSPSPWEAFSKDLGISMGSQISKVFSRQMFNLQ